MSVQGLHGTKQGSHTFQPGDVGSQPNVLLARALPLASLFFLSIMFASHCHSKPRPLVVLDAGHDQVRPDATAASGTPEHILNRDVRDAITRDLRQRGIRVVWTQGGLKDRVAKTNKLNIPI